MAVSNDQRQTVLDFFLALGNIWDSHFMGYSFVNPRYKSLSNEALRPSKISSEDILVTTLCGLLGLSYVKCLTFGTNIKSVA